MDRWAALRKILDAARVALAGLVALVALLAANGDVLGLPPGVTAALVGAVTLAGQWGIRTKTTPDAEPDPSQVPELADTPEFAALTDEAFTPRGELEEAGSVGDGEDLSPRRRRRPAPDAPQP